MTELDTDEEKIEAIKKWWKTNGVAVMAGVAIGLGAVIGWRTWVDYRTNHAQRASLAFEQLQMTADAGEAASVQKQAELIVEDFGGTPYAMLAELTAARVALANDDPAAASAALERAIDRAPDPALATLAALRLARVQVAQGELDAAVTTIAHHGQSGPFAADFAALRGDIAAAQGRIDEARAAYRTALDGNAGNARLIELKLQDLPADEAS